MSQHHHKIHRLHSGRWERARKECFRLAGYRCSRCGRASRLEAHHIIGLPEGGPPFEQSNLECLCKQCHIAHHGEDEDPERKAWREVLENMAES